MIRACLTAALLAVLASPALAHAPIKGIGAFYNGLLHPVLVPAHLMVLIGLGLLLGQHAPKMSRRGWIGFLLALWSGLAAAHIVGPSVPEAILLVLALIAGALVMLDRPFAGMLAGLVAILSGIAIGIDSPPDTAVGREAWLALAGTGVGALLVVSYVGGIAASLKSPVLRMGVRVAGSWTAACAGIVLALALASPVS